MKKSLRKGASKDRLAAIIEKVIPAQQRVELAAALARGVVMQVVDEKTKEVKRVYAAKPDMDAIRFLEEYATGKPVQKQQIAVEDGFGCIIVPAMAAPVNVAELRFEREQQQKKNSTKG